MDYQELLRKRDAYQEGKHLIPELTIASYERAFEIEYTHHSTAIEGNTLSLMETKYVYQFPLGGDGGSEKINSHRHRNFYSLFTTNRQQRQEKFLPLLLH